MDNTELDNVEKNDTGLNAEQMGIGVGILGFLFGIGIKAWHDNRALKKEREKNALYQEAIKKHQAIIDELRIKNERREYRDKLWEELNADKEGSNGQI